MVLTILRESDLLAVDIDIETLVNACLKRIEAV